MNRNKFLSVCLVVVMLAAIPASMAFAAPGTATLGTGTIQSINIDTSVTPTTVIVTLIDSAGLAEKVTISLETAVKMGLVTAATATSIPAGILTFPGGSTGTVSTVALATDSVTGITSVTVTLTDLTTVSLSLSEALALGLVTTTVDSTKIGTSTVIDSTTILNSTTYNKTVTNLGNYFGPALGVTFDQLAADFAAGYGYGVITQAAWMTSNLGGNATLLNQILTAKSTGDYSGIVLPGGVTVTNWGQLRKLALTSPHQNLGSIMSGKATPLPTPTATATATTNTATTTTTTSTTSIASNGNGNSNGTTGKSNSTGNSNGTSNGNGNSNGTTGKSNGTGNGNGNGNSGNSNGKGPKK